MIDQQAIEQAIVGKRVDILTALSELELFFRDVAMEVGREARREFEATLQSVNLADELIEEVSEDANI